MSDMKQLRPQLEQVQEYHINLLEEWGQNQTVLSGVPIIQMFTYEFLQIINNAYLKGIVGG